MGADISTAGIRVGACVVVRGKALIFVGSNEPLEMWPVAGIAVDDGPIDKLRMEVVLVDVVVGAGEVELAAVVGVSFENIDRKFGC